MALSTVVKTSCDTIKITNTTLSGVSYVIAKLNPITLVYEEVENGTLDGYIVVGTPPDQVTTYDDYSVLLADGLYKITVSQEGEADDVFIKTLFCSLEACYIDLFKTAVCNEVNKCCDECSTKNKLNLSNFNMLLQVYFSILKKYETFNSPFATLDTETLADLVQLSKITTNLEKYCKKCNCGCK